MVMRLSSCISSFVLWRWHVDNLQRHDNKKDRKAKDWIIKMIKLQELLDQQEKEKSEYKVAICVTSYNQINYIEKALTSLLHQKTDFPYLIVVGDDCSTDGSCELLESIQKDNSDRVKILFQSKNVGLFQNRKSIFLQCDAPYIAFCDGDDYWIDDTVLQKKVDFLEAHKEYIGYQTACFFEQGGKISETTDLGERGCFVDFSQKEALNNAYPGQVGGFFFRNVYRYMTKEDFETYTAVRIDDSGKLPILAATIAPIYRQDKMPTFVYRYCDGSMSRQEEKRNVCEQLFYSHLMYQDMLSSLKIDLKMDIDAQLMELIVNAFITAVKTTLRSGGADNREQFMKLYHDGHFAKKEIRSGIRKEIWRRGIEKYRNVMCMHRIMK